MRVGKDVEGSWRVEFKGLEGVKEQGQFGKLQCGVGRQRVSGDGQPLKGRGKGWWSVSRQA